MGCLQGKTKNPSMFFPENKDRLQHIDKQANYKLVTSIERIHDVYKLDEKIIGSGSFGHIRIARNLQTGMKVAIKTIKKDKIKDQLDMFVQELKILQQIDHPNIVKFYEVYEEKFQFHLVLEYCSGGDLYDRLINIDSFNEYDAANILLPVFQAVNYLHSIGICHRDLKLENIMFKDKSFKTVKIIDFGLSCKTSVNEPLKSLLGTPLYLAPEVQQNLSQIILIL